MYFDCCTILSDARGQFTYWSQRTFARPVNRGIRLDYFVCSESILPPITTTDDSCSGVIEGEEGVPAPRTVTPATNSTAQQLQVYDSYILYEDTVGCSDHCPVMLVLTLPQTSL